ncbi:iron-containing alcohol dehydrogenase family protein [Lactococcus nasutitermitis]|uniref:Iron-containing alcohol dehydrogenase family protein n=1 Tax=Lactococcus nasutitermitis TaxID=1652957 RepID=A0ABV9JCN6_9LACT|nr:iron-containing alcohol dehydrogenase family protein [Lactococcus nasutitermitis]
MNIAEEVRPGANRYVSGQGILQELELYLTDFGKIAVVTGEKSFRAFSDFYQKDLPYPIFRYDGTVSVEDGERLAAEIAENGETDTILAIGAGRVLDTAKLVAENLSARLIILPTLISNCAPYTPIGAIYHPDHSFHKVAYFSRVSELTLVDVDFLLGTPRDYLVAGIGDTLAKWYEMEGIVRHVPAEELSASTRLGFASAQEILKILLADSAPALLDLEAQKVTTAFERIADAIIELSGTVGGFAGAYGRMAGAHALHNGLSLLSETHAILHGAKVAYGVLVQLSYTNDWEEIAKILPFYQASSLPTTLAELNIATFDREKLREVADFAAGKNESYNLIDPDVTAEKVLTAIEKLEKFVAEQ